MDAATWPEMWLPVVGYEDRYEVSSFGRVRSLLFVNGKANKVRQTPLILKAAKVAGYPAVTLAQNGTKRTEHVHRMVALSFLGPCPSPRHLVAHCDGSRDNNTVENLRWKTYEENEADKTIHGTHIRGSRNPFASLTEEAVMEIRRRYHLGESGRSLAREFSVSETNISRIVLRHSWKHVPEADGPQRKRCSKPSGYRNDWRINRRNAELE